MNPTIKYMAQLIEHIDKTNRILYEQLKKLECSGLSAPIDLDFPELSPNPGQPEQKKVLGIFKKKSYDTKVCNNDKCKQNKSGLCNHKKGFKNEIIIY
jgi:hypothetical protein